jgi:hypothetical protein
LFAISTSLGFGGNNAAIVVARRREEQELRNRDRA